MADQAPSNIIMNNVVGQGQVLQPAFDYEPDENAYSMTSSAQPDIWVRGTSSYTSSAGYRQDVDWVLKLELGPLHVGIPHFHETYFGRIAGLAKASEAVFQKCTEGTNPLFSHGWSAWPQDADPLYVFGWFARLSRALADFSEAYRPSPARRRRLIALPNRPTHSSMGEYKVDVSFADDLEAGRDSRRRWSHMLVPGELRSTSSTDEPSKSWFEIGTYARDVLATQDTRRFTMAFTIHGSLMRVWEFDRLGGIASEQFDINQDGQRFVSTILGFLWMNEEELGFDPTIMTTANNKRFIEIERDGSTERLIIDKMVHRAYCIAGRGTTCWKAHREGHPQTPLVIKDSWQYVGSEEEGELLREVTNKGVPNMARYYHHETVQIDGKDDDIRTMIRRGPDVTRSTSYRRENLMPPLSNMASDDSQKDRSSSSSAAGKKRPSSRTEAALPCGKRSCLASPTKAGSDKMPNRVHRRIILRDYGKPIYKASSRVALLTALEGCIDTHETLLGAGFLHRDISLNNLMINEHGNNPSWPFFLIDLDYAVRHEREHASGAGKKIGTNAFMAIGALRGELHTFMHDLESFFWVLFWICIHYHGPGHSRFVANFDEWRGIRMDWLARLKKKTICREEDFIKIAEAEFTLYYQPLIPWVNRLRKAVFPNDDKSDVEDMGLYARMREIIREAREDPKVAKEG